MYISHLCQKLRQGSSLSKIAQQRNVIAHLYFHPSTFKRHANLKEDKVYVVGIIPGDSNRTGGISI